LGFYEGLRINRFSHLFYFEYLLSRGENLLKSPTILKFPDIPRAKKTRNHRICNLFVSVAIPRHIRKNTKSIEDKGDSTISDILWRIYRLSYQTDDRPLPFGISASMFQHKEKGRGALLRAQYI
jgi:hypothetical protein